MVAADEVRVWKAANGHGTPFLWSEEGAPMWGYLGTRHPRASSPTVLSPVWLRQIFDHPALIAQMPGVFGLVVVDREQRRTLVACDRLGIQSVYYTKTHTGDWMVSTQGMWLLLASGCDGTVNDEAFFSYVGFGYNINATPGLYTGIDRLQPGGYLVIQNARLHTGTYWTPPELTGDLGDDFPGGDVPTLAQYLRAAVETTLVEKPFLGLSAGKDSLCIASVLEPDTAMLSGTFGMPGCSDRVQGEALASRLGWPHGAFNVASVTEFADRVTHLAFYSAGMATSSYVDFVAFIDQCIPPEAAYIMGEGGECVRDFFRMEGGTFMDKLVQVYTTPIEYLRATLNERFYTALDDYPTNIIDMAKAAAEQPDDDIFFVHFYRYQRMFGNFGPRHDVLSALRARVCPFEDAQFIEATYRLKTSYYTGSGVHRAIIAHARPDLLPFFDHPIQLNQHIQDWQTRFANGTGRVVRQLLADTLPLCEDVFNRAGVLTLCDVNMQSPSRAIYHLLRLLSFAVARRIVRREAALRLAAINAASFRLVLK